MRPSDLLKLTPSGLCCPLGGFHIDPVKPVERAIITHGHSDHARAGHGAVLATDDTLAIMAARYGENFSGSTQAAAYGEAFDLGAITVTLVPAGHVLGSAQVVIESKADAGSRALRIVASGDYKREADPTCEPFRPVACDVFITEATFGLPVFRHPPAIGEIDKLLKSVALFPERTHIIGAYALGKAQRVMALIRQAGYDKPIYLHGAMERLTALYGERGIDLGPVEKVPTGGPRGAGKLPGAIVLCPPSAMQELWARRFADPVTCFASGWMRVRARARQKGVELPLVISDHADWDDLTRTIDETGAGEVWVTHGEEDALVHWCTTRGLAARPLHMLGYGDEGEAEPDAAAAPIPPETAELAP